MSETANLVQKLQGDPALLADLSGMLADHLLNEAGRAAIQGEGCEGSGPTAMRASWEAVDALSGWIRRLGDAWAPQKLKDAWKREEILEREAIRSADAGSARGVASSFPCTRRITSYSPTQDSVVVGIYLDTIRKARLKQKYGWGMGVPKVSQAAVYDTSLPPASDTSLVDRSDVHRRLERKDVPAEQLADADALQEVGLPKRANRREVCGLLYELSQCACPKTWKTWWECRLRSCPTCAPKIFARAFSQLILLDDYIPTSLKSLPLWGWKTLDFAFRHDGEFAPRNVLRKMRQVVNRTTDRAYREQCSETYNAAFYSKRVLRKGKDCYVRALCPVRFAEKDGKRWPMSSRAGWPLVSAPDGSVRDLKGWDVVWVGKKEKRPTCVRCGSRVKRVKSDRRYFLDAEGAMAAVCERARSCPKCGPVQWPDWENQKIDAGRWRLRFGIVHIVPSEFGCDNFNYHFHTAFFGPYLPNKPTCSECKSVLRRKCRTCGSLVRDNKTPTRGWDCANCGHVDRNDEGKLDWDCPNHGHVVGRNAQGEMNWDCPNYEALAHVVDGRLTQIFREESKKALGRESWDAWIEKAKGGYHGVLAHSFKYTAKIPASTPGGRAAYEKALVGVRRYAVRGLLQGVEIAEEKSDPPRCLDCGKTIRKIPGLGPVPFFEVEDIPLLRDDSDTQMRPPQEPGEDSFDGPEETFAHAPRAPC